MASRVWFFALVLLLSACRVSVRQEFSDPLHEEAVISEAVYTPSHHDLALRTTMYRVGTTNLGVDHAGDLGLRIGSGSAQISAVEVPEKFAIVFKCQHGQFIITREDIYHKLKDHLGKTVDVSYREEYRSTYETEDGTKRLVNRVLVGYDFLDANLK